MLSISLSRWIILSCPSPTLVVAEEFYVARLRRRDYQAQRLEHTSTQTRRRTAYVYSDRRQTHGRLSAERRTPEAAMARGLPTYSFTTTPQGWLK